MQGLLGQPVMRRPSTDSCKEKDLSMSPCRATEGPERVMGLWDLSIRLARAERFRPGQNENITGMRCMMYLRSFFDISPNDIMLRDCLRELAIVSVRVMAICEMEFPVFIPAIGRSFDIPLNEDGSAKPVWESLDWWTAKFKRLSHLYCGFSGVDNLPESPNKWLLYHYLAMDFTEFAKEVSHTVINEWPYMPYLPRLPSESTFRLENPLVMAKEDLLAVLANGKLERASRDLFQSGALYDVIFPVGETFIEAWSRRMLALTWDGKEDSG